MKKDKVLLVGNGINNIENKYKWSDLVADLIEFVGATRQININKKPFPLLYEEIVAHAVRKEGIEESEIKKFIASRISKFRPNQIHMKIMGLGLGNLLTTNYDYTLEQASGSSTLDKLVHTGKVRESRYSLFRVVKVKKTRVWHIHGERSIPKSIALGYEHYSGYLQSMRNYVVMGTEKAYKHHFDVLEKQLKNGTVGFDSWLDFFFIHDIYIVGLTLDFIEMHLWWLLTYRARRQRGKQSPAKNQITYFYPDNLKEEIGDKLDLLKANDVVPIPISFKSGDWNSYYRRVLERIQRA